MSTQFRTLFSINQPQDLPPAQIKEEALSLLSSRKALKAAVKQLNKQEQNQVTKARRTLGKEIRETQQKYLIVNPDNIAQTAMKLNSATIPTGLIGLSLLKRVPTNLESAKGLVIDWTLEQIRQEQIRKTVVAEAADLDAAKFASLETAAREAPALEPVIPAPVETGAPEADDEDALLEKALLASIETAKQEDDDDALLESILASLQTSEASPTKEVPPPSSNSAPAEKTTPAGEPEKIPEKGKEVPVEETRPDFQKKEPVKNEQTKKTFWSKFMGFLKSIFSGIASIFTGRKANK